jgi:SH3-like domain-containing protein
MLIFRLPDMLSFSFTNRFLVLFSIIICCFSAYNASAGNKVNLPIPRFVSVKSSEVNVRAGPNYRYPIKWVFVKKGEPVEVIAEFEQWRKIRDKQGDEGWVHETMLSGRRYVIIIGDKPLIVYQKADLNSKPIFQVEPDVRSDLLECSKEWCRIQASQNKGWIERKNLWGVYSNEEIE